MNYESMYQPVPICQNNGLVSYRLNYYMLLRLPQMPFLI
nr:MAG TPA: hypothetical protein [Bacteriophage sp.]